MLVTHTQAATRLRRGLSARAAGGLMLLAAVLLVLPYLGSGTELVRLRNALSLGEDVQEAQIWSPPDVPADFRQETVPPDPYFVAVAARLGLAALPDDWARGVAISRHLLGSAPVLNGGAVKSDLKGTHRAIVEHGDGYCGDFVRVFTAIANAAGMTVRPWAFSFDGFGGHGHIWLEVWNRQLSQWQLVNIFDNHYYLDGRQQPLSALALRRAIVSGAAGLQLRALHPGARPGYAIEAKAWDYLRRGVNEWYLPWGNNVFTQDRAWAVRAFSGISRLGEGLGAWVSGAQPSVRLLALPGNEDQRAAMHSLRLRLFGAALLGFVGLGLVLLGPWLARQRRQVPSISMAESVPASTKGK